MSPLRVLSLGAGVQSSTLYLMAVSGEFGAERPTVAIFADTQWEPRAVYRWLDELEKIGGAAIPIRRVTAGNLREAALSRVNTNGHLTRRVSLPVYVAVPKEDPRQSMLWEMEILRRPGALIRQCTGDFKLDVIRRAIRNELGIGPRASVRSGAVEQWIGISTDEADRMTQSKVAFVANRYPLVEREMSRADCVNWLADHGYAEPPKSACVGCPFTSGERWAEMKQNRPDEFADAVSFDREIRHGLAGVEHPVYLHRSLKPLEEVQFDTSDKRGGFTNECQGICGV